MRHVVLWGLVAACRSEPADEDGDGIENDLDPCPLTEGSSDCPELLFAALFDDPEQAPADWTLTGTWTFHDSLAEQRSAPATMARPLEAAANQILTKLELTELGLDSAVTVYAGGAACTLRDEGDGAELFLVTSAGAAVMPTLAVTSATRSRKLQVRRDPGTTVVCTSGDTRLSLPHDMGEWPGELMLEALNTKIRVLHVGVQP